jgi:beta-lactamase regulating signal transducer with metallopeptidase domain
MDIFQNFIHQDYLLALGWMIVHALWQIAMTGLLFWLVLRIFNRKSAAFKYRLGLASLMLIALLSIVTFGIQLQQPKVTGIAGLSEDELTYLMTNRELLNFEKAGIGPTPTWVLISRSVENSIPDLVNIWFVGALLFLVRMATGMADLRQLHQKTHHEAEPKWLEFIRNQQGILKISRPVRLLSSIHIDMPLTYGILKPVILVPSALFLQLSPAQLEAIITHELAHVKRHDYLINLIQSMLEVVFFFHPVFWWINKEIKEQRENACDELAISKGISPKDLAYGLVNVLNRAQQHVPEMALAAAKKNTPTLDRIKRIMGVKTSPTQPTTLTTLTMMITLLLGATLVVGAYDHANPKESGDYLTTKSHTKTLDLDLEMKMADSYLDTVPAKKNPRNFTDSIIERPLSPEELENIRENLAPLKDDLAMLFKEMEFNLGEFSAMPQLDFNEIPLPDFNFENMPKLEMDPKVWQNMIPDSTFFNGIPYPNFPPLEVPDFLWDKSMSEEDSIKYNQELKEKMAIWKEEQKAWLEANSEKIAQWKEEMKAEKEEWKKNLEPQMKDFQEKIKEWEKENQPRIEEFKAKMKAWEKENQPKIEEFQRKMQEWQKTNEEKMKEFQEKMEEWQNEHEKELEELKKKTIESVKNNDN